MPVSITAYTNCSSHLVIEPFCPPSTSIGLAWWVGTSALTPTFNLAHLLHIVLPRDTQSGFGTLCKDFHSTIESSLLQLMNWMLRHSRRPCKRQRSLIFWNSKMKTSSRGSHCFVHCNKVTSISRLLVFSLADRSTRSRY